MRKNYLFKLPKWILKSKLKLFYSLFWQLFLKLICILPVEYISLFNHCINVVLNISNQWYFMHIHFLYEIYEFLLNSNIKSPNFLLSILCICFKTFYSFFDLFPIFCQWFRYFLLFCEISLWIFSKSSILFVQNWYFIENKFLIQLF